MEAIAMEDGSIDPLIKRETEPDSSERDAESPDDGGHITVKDEPLDDLSLSPASDRQSGSGGEDRELKINRRKRKNPVKVLSNQNSHEELDQEITKPKQPQLQQPKQCSVMTEERARNQAINSMPRSTCPICGDKANGLHYGIYTCEACKNFFKRSVAFDAAKSYVCKYNKSCNVNITEVDGVKMKGPRCQACRYQACLDAGMYHSGVQRTRGGRHGYSPIKQRSGSVEKYPTIATPNISAAMANVSHEFEPADLVSVSMSPSEQSEESAENNVHSFLQQNQIWEQFVTENVRNEVELLKSRTAIAETLLAEKTKQFEILQKQVEMLKNHLISADQLNKEQAITIESLKRRLNHNGTNGKSNGDKMSIFENGGAVTITPVVTSSQSIQVNSNRSQNLLSHLLTSNGKNNSGDMATIEPISKP